MGCTVREKHIRTNRRCRSVKPDIDPCVHRASISKSIMESEFKPMNSHVGVTDPIQNPNPNSSFDDSGWGYCTEEQLEEILLTDLEFVYNEAISKLVALGYDADIALKAVLRNGHCYGGMDVLTNILHNSLAFLNSSFGSSSSSNVSGEVFEKDLFPNLRELEEYSLHGMVGLLQQVRPHLSKGDAMWCLLMSDLHVGRASSLEIPVPAPSGNGCSPRPSNVENDANNSVGVVTPALCRFHGGWGFGNEGSSEFPVEGFLSDTSDMSLEDFECLKRLNHSTSMKSLMKRNVSAFAAGFRANSKHLETQSQACPRSLVNGDVPPVDVPSIPAAESPAEQLKESPNWKNQDVVTAALNKFRDLNIDESLEYVDEVQKDELIITLIHQIKDLDQKVKERKEWAQEKAMQAARRLSHDLAELKILRMEREETQQLMKGKQTLEDSTMKRLSEMENALRKASGQVDRANAAVRRLEIENAEIRAEMEASKLSASESVITCLEVARRERKCLKRLLAWEKQKARLHKEIEDEKAKMKELQQLLNRSQQGQKQAKIKWRQELKAKDLALAQVEDEQRSKEAAEGNNKRKHEALRLKIEIDFQRHKDDLQRLEQEFSCLKASCHSTEQNPSNTLPTGRKMSRGETIAALLNDLDELEDSSDKGHCDRECILCMKDEVSVVFLPCAHQVLCSSCNESFGRKGKATCPCCRTAIEQRIRVFGMTS